MNKNSIIVIVIIIVIAIGCGSFYGGMVYGKSQSRPRNFPGMTGQGPNGNMRGQANGANFTNGEVIAKDDQSLSIKIRDNGSKIILFSASTKISKSVDGTAEDLAVGQNLMITGKENSDGSISAETIQIRPVAVQKPGLNPAPVNATVK
ncbi:MAG: hypothetical protein NTZ49_04130 [Candidatus Parcubacteria bacterium]|nr:hypothetical protein [Candidatus Parcubacteria bacterium]